MIKEAQKAATYDEAGRAVRTTVPTSENEKITVSLKYGEQDRIQAVVLDDGTQVGLVYDDSGKWKGFSFPDGGKMLFKHNASGAIIGLKRVAKPASQRAPGVRRVGFGAPWVDECATAVAAAVAAAASATATCLEGPSVQCAAAVAAAAVAGAKAYNACKDRDAAEEESAV